MTISNNSVTNNTSSDITCLRAAADMLMDKHGKPIWQTCADGTDSCFAGFANEERHRTCGSRAWCDCGEWCYPIPDGACRCCEDHVISVQDRATAGLLHAVARAIEDLPRENDSTANDVRTAAIALSNAILGLDLDEFTDGVPLIPDLVHRFLHKGEREGVGGCG